MAEDYYQDTTPIRSPPRRFESTRSGSGSDEDNYNAPNMEQRQQQQQHTPGGHDYSNPNSVSTYTRFRRSAKSWLSSKKKHYFVLTLVSLDVGALLSDIFIALVACDLDKQEEPWVEHAREALHIIGTIFGGLFLLELAATIWAFGRAFFKQWFHCFDAFVIIAGFIIDVATHGTVEEIASLIIIFRLWRFVKIVEEVSLGAAERMEDLEVHIEHLKRENENLKSQIESARDGRTS